MPNIKSAKKRVKVTQARTLRNKMLRSELKTAIKKYNAAAAWVIRLPPRPPMLPPSKVDKASARGIIHKTKLREEEPVYQKA